MPVLAVLLYDQDCGFCRWSVAQVLKRDAQLRILPLPIQSSEGEQLLDAMPEPQRFASWHLAVYGSSSGHVPPETAVLSSSGAVAPQLLRLLDRHSLAFAFERAAPWVEVAYRIIAKSRGMLGRLLISPEAKASADMVIEERNRLMTERHPNLVPTSAPTHDKTSERRRPSVVAVNSDVGPGVC